MPVPTWALSISYWLHMLATVVWMGSLSALALLIFPAVRQELDPPHYADLLNRVLRRLDPLGWFCLLLLIGTGLVQMSASSNYGGFLAIDNRWAAAILAKHILFLVMAGLSAYLTWGLLPKLRRLALAQKIQREANSDVVDSLVRQEMWLVRLNLVLGFVVLLLTAIARST